MEDKWEEALKSFYERYPYAYPLLLAAAAVAMIAIVCVIGFWGS